MRALQRALFALGTVAVVGGLFVTAVPGAAPFDPGDVAVYALAILGTALVVASLQSRRFADFEQATTPDPEERHAFTRPGADLDRYMIRAYSGSDVDAIRSREHLFDRLYPIAVGVVMRRHNVSRDRAETMLETGEWTDDRYAARYFAGPSVEIPLSERLQHRARGESWRAACATNAIEELAEEVRQ